MTNWAGIAIELKTLGPCFGGVMFALSDYDTEIVYIVNFDGSNYSIIQTFPQTGDLTTFDIDEGYSFDVPYFHKTSQNEYICNLGAGNDNWPIVAYRSRDSGLTFEPFFSSYSSEAVVVQAADGRYFARERTPDPPYVDRIMRSDLSDPPAFSEVYLEPDLTFDPYHWWGAAHPTEASIVAFWGQRQISNAGTPTNPRDDPYAWRLVITQDGGDSWSVVEYNLETFSAGRTWQSNSDAYSYDIKHVILTDTGRLIGYANEWVRNITAIPGPVTPREGRLRIFYSDPPYTTLTPVLLANNTSGDQFFTQIVMGCLTGNSSKLFLINGLASANYVAPEAYIPYMSVDNGASWTALPSPIWGGGGGDYNSAMEYDPTADVLYIMGAFAYGSPQSGTQPLLQRMVHPSISGTWEDVSAGLSSLPGLSSPYNIDLFNPQSLWLA